MGSACWLVGFTIAARPLGDARVSGCANTPSCVLIHDTTVFWDTTSCGKAAPPTHTTPCLGHHQLWQGSSSHSHNTVFGTPPAVARQLLPLTQHRV
jgi:hypothetical protein